MACTPVIFTDSQSSIQAISRPYSKNPLVTSIQGIIHKLPSPVQLCWIPGHIGIRGNETADLLDKRATTNRTYSENFLLKSDLKSKIRNKTRDSWLRLWAATPTNSNKLREITETLSPLPNSTCQERRWERALCRLRIGHCRITHGHLMSGGREPPICDKCPDEAVTTVKHLLIECTGLQHDRIRAFGYRPTNLKSILVDGNTSPGGPLYNFIYNTDLIKFI